MPGLISISEFVEESREDVHSPTTSTFVSRMAQCRQTVAALEEVSFRNSPTRFAYSQKGVCEGYGKMATTITEMKVKQCAHGLGWLFFPWLSYEHSSDCMCECVFGVCVWCVSVCAPLLHTCFISNYLEHSFCSIFGLFSVGFL